VSVGISSIAEFQIDGGLYNRLKITNRQDAPLSDFLKIDGDTTSDFQDVIVATKIRVLAEIAEAPVVCGCGLRRSMPMATNEDGIGLDTMDFFATLLVAKTVQSVRIVGNGGVGILTSPTSIGAQNDVLLYGASFARALTDSAELVGEINGRWSTRPGGAFPVPSRDSLLNIGARYTTGSLRLDGGLFFGLTTLDPTVGFAAGFTYVFTAFESP
jgi:hypothetical protein